MKPLKSLIALILTSVAAVAQSTDNPSTSQEVLTLDLPTALKIADARNTDLAIRIQEVYQAELAQDEAWYQWLPTLRAGVGYTYQDGDLQDTRGNVFDVSRNARSGGLGVAQTGSGLPGYPGLSLEIDIADAIYAPQIADEYFRASEAERDETRFLKTLEVINAYYNLVLAQQAIQLHEQAVREAETLAKTTGEFANAGQGLQADADRAAVEQLLREHQLEAAQIRRERASKELKRILNLRDGIVIRSAEQTLVPLLLIDEMPNPSDAVSQAFKNRMAIKALEYRMQAERLKTEREENGVFIPKLGASYSYGAFDGGTGYDGGNGGPRNDVTVAVYWELDNLGFVNRSYALRGASEQRVLQARLDQVRTDVSTEIRMAITELQSTARQLDILRDGLSRARSGYQLSRERIFENQGLPLEALSAFESLTEMEMLYAQTVARYNQAQLFLLKATGRNVISKDRTHNGGTMVKPVE